MTTPDSDPHDLARFITAQEAIIDRVRAELRAGRKTSHWMWFVFPQIVGLGRSETARFYAIRTHQEAAAYLAHPCSGRDWWNAHGWSTRWKVQRPSRSSDKLMQ